MRSNAAKKTAYIAETVSAKVPAPKALAHKTPAMKLVEKTETTQYDELVSVDYEAFLLQYGIRSDFA